MWNKLQIGLIVLACLLVFVGDRLSVSLLFFTGMACFGMVALVFGWEAIVTRHIVVGWRRRGNRVAYTGLPAIFQGIQFNFIGLFLIFVAVTAYMKANVREMFLQMVRHPGLPLVVLGVIILMQAAITMSGSPKQGEEPPSEVIIDLLARFLPGFFLVIIGLGLMGLGLFEIVAPNAFDAMGGGLLEMLYGLK